MAHDIIDSMTAKYNSLTRSGKKVADYIFANRIDVQFMSITSLADECEVAEATVFRLCKAIGLSGYNDLKLELAKAAGANMPIEDHSLYGRVTPEDSIPNMCRKLYSTNVAALTKTLELINESSVNMAANYIEKAKHVYCFGQGGSLVLAMEAWARFLTVSPKFYCIEDSHLQAMSASLAEKDDVILFFTYTGATRDMLDVLTPARKRGAKTIVFTHFKRSPVTAHADVVLLCGSKEGPLQSGSVAAKMGNLLLIDVLFNEYCRRHFDEYITNKELTTKSIADKLL